MFEDPIDDMLNEINYDATNVKMMDGPQPIPDGEYDLIITGVKPGRTQKGFPMVNVTLSVNDGEYQGKKVWHNVTFFPPKDETTGMPHKGAGYALHFLSCIGEPHKGQFTAKPFDWIGKSVQAKVRTAKYTDKEGNEKTKNEIAWFIKSLSVIHPDVDIKTAVNDDTPF